jgi:hypothetical protein
MVEELTLDRAASTAEQEFALLHLITDHRLDRSLIMKFNNLVFVLAVLANSNVTWADITCKGVTHVPMIDAGREVNFSLKPQSDGTLSGTAKSDRTEWMFAVIVSSNRSDVTLQIIDGLNLFPGARSEVGFDSNGRAGIAYYGGGRPVSAEIDLSCEKK